MKKFSCVLFLSFIFIFCFSLVFASCDTNEGVSVVSIRALTDTFVTKYTVGDSINLDNAKIEVTYSNGSTDIVPVTRDMVDDASFSTLFPANRKTLKIFYENCFCTIPYQVQDKQVEISITNSYLENMPSSFLKGEDLPLVNGFIENAFLCIELSNDNSFKYPVKGIWINSFSTKKAGENSCSVDYESDYGKVSVVWKYSVQDLASVSSVDFDYSISIYQNQDENNLRNALSGKTFAISYSDGSLENVEYSADFKISSFSSEKVGNAKCTLSFLDSKGRTIKFTLEYVVKQVYPVYSVVFDPNYEGATKITVKTFDGKVSTPALTRNGYETLGWYLYENEMLSSEPFNFDSIIEKDIVLRPRWRRLTYSITIYSFGTLLRTPEEYNVETERPLENPAPIDGYTFSHFADETGTVYNSISKGTFGNLVLHCVWIANGYDIEYDLNDSNSNFKATNPNPDTYSSENIVEFLPPTRKGYNFEGWFYNNEIITSTEGLAKNIKLTAKWSIAEYTLSLVNPLNEEVIRTIKYKVTDSNTRIADFESDLYFFYGWYKNRDFSEEFSYDASHNYYLPSGSAGDFSIFAKLENKYTLILDGRNNLEAKKVFFKESDETVNIPIPVKFGSDFLSWLGQGIFNGISLQAENGEILLETETIKVIMRENNTQSANFIASYDYHSWNIVYYLYNEQGQDITQNDTFHTNIQKDLPLPERDGFVFLGWYKNASFQGSSYESILPFSLDSDVGFYAKWQAIVYTITVDYYFDDVEKLFIPKTYTANDQFELPYLSYPNYTFLGWYKDADYSVLQPTFIDRGTTGNLTLFAKFEAVSIELNLLNMSSAIYNGNITYTLEENEVVLSDAKNAGYAFDGWYLDRNLTVKVERFTPSDYPENRPFTAYAKWALVDYSISYVLNDNATFPAKNDNPQNINFEQTLSLNVPRRNGFTFLGWFYTASFEGNSVEILSKTTNDIVLYAKWVERVYNLTYENCDFEGVDLSKLPKTFKATSTGTTVPSLTRKHYTFDGWFIEENKITKVGIANDDALCEDLTLTAKWTPKPYTLSFSASGKTAKITYTIEDFQDGVYTIPSLDSLVPQTFDEVVLKGKAFVGWYKGSNTQTLYTQISISELANLSFNALTSYISYNIVYHLPEGAANAETNPDTFTTQAKTISIASPTLENKVFSAWYLDQNFTISAGSVSSGKTNVSTTNEDIHLYAKFVDIHTITYELPSGVTLSSSAPKNYNETKAVAISNPTTSLNFGGWWWIEGKTIVSNTKDFSDFGNVSLLALVYEKSASAKIVFDLNEENNTASVVGFSGSGSLKFPLEVSGFKVTNIVDTAFFGNTLITSVIIPNSISSVGYRSFANCSKLASVTIEGGSISSEAFANCPLLKTVSISREAIVADGILAGCTAISTMSVGNNKAVVSYFSKNASVDCTVCAGYYVPNSLTSIKILSSNENTNGILSSCSLVKSFYIEGNNLLEISLIDINTLKNNQATVYVNSTLLEEYKNRYEGITFLSI